MTTKKFDPEQYRGDNLAKLLTHYNARTITQLIAEDHDGHRLILVDKKYYPDGSLNEDIGFDCLNDTARYGWMLGNYNDGCWAFGTWDWSHDRYCGTGYLDPKAEPEKFPGTPVAYMDFPFPI